MEDQESRHDEYPPTQDLYDHEDEMIDTLSLSDLMIYENNVDTQEFYRVDDMINRNLDVNDEFEFSSELIKTPVSNNVVFCGKIIPYKEPSVPQNTHKLENKKQQKQRCRLVTFFKKSGKSKANLESKKVDLKYEVPIRRVSILASATKPRWYFLMFGVGSSRFPTQMHMRDLKKRHASISKISGGDGGGNGSWRLVRLLGCGGGEGGGNHHPSAIVKIE